MCGGGGVCGGGGGVGGGGRIVVSQDDDLSCLLYFVSCRASGDSFICFQLFPETVGDPA